jgi:hypothetical protein
MTEKKPDLEVLEEAVAGVYLREAECRIQPSVGPTYYVYLRKDKTSFISLVEPEYWDYKRFPIKFVCKATYNESGWRELPAD